MKFKLDESVWLSPNRYRNPDWTEAVVTKVGRRWVYIDNQHDRRHSRYDGDTGREDTNYGAPQRIETEAMRAEAIVRSGAVARIKAHDVDLGRHHNLTTAQLVAVADAIEASA